MTWGETNFWVKHWLPRSLSYTSAVEIVCPGQRVHFTLWGSFRELHSDQSRNFEATVFQQICQLVEQQKSRTTALHPQSDAIVEKIKRTMKKKCSKWWHITSMIETNTFLYFSGLSSVGNVWAHIWQHTIRTRTAPSVRLEIRLKAWWNNDTTQKLKQVDFNLWLDMARSEMGIHRDVVVNRQNCSGREKVPTKW